MFSAFGEAESRALEALSGPLLPLHCTGSTQGGKVRTGNCGRWNQNQNQYNPMQAGGDICAGNIAPPLGFPSCLMQRQVTLKVSTVFTTCSCHLCLLKDSALPQSSISSLPQPANKTRSFTYF